MIRNGGRCTVNLHSFIVCFRVADADEGELESVVVLAQVASPTDERFHHGALRVRDTCLS